MRNLGWPTHGETPRTGGSPSTVQARRAIEPWARGRVRAGDRSLARPRACTLSTCRRRGAGASGFRREVT